MDDLKLTKAQLEKIKLIKQDFYKFAKMNLYIKDKFANIVPFVPNEPQRALIDYVLLCIQEKRPVKVIILKARQMGFSTAVEALCYWWTSTNFNINSVIIGNDEKSSLNLYRMFRRYFDNTNILFKPSVRYNTKSDLTFEKFDENGKQIGLGSAIKIETAKNKSAGRSDTVNFLHASELGAWENGEDLVASLMQTVPDAEVMEKPSMVFLESTAEGRGNYFHKEYVAAVNKKNNYQPLFAPWWILDTYERDATFDDLGQLNDYESFLVELMKKGHETLGHKFTIKEESIPRKIAYYRRKAKDFAATPERLPQEYPSTWEESFIASGKNVFNPLALQEMEKDATPLEVVDYYKITPIENRPYEEFELEKVSFEPNETPDDFTYKAPLKIWEKPKPYKEYVIGADVAEGLKGGDFSVATVVDISTMAVVARWRGHCDPDKFGEILGALGTYYNYALIGVEVNNHGLTTVQKLRDTFYTNLYKRDRGYDEEWETPTVNLGWKTDMRTKRLMIDDLIKLVRERVIKDKDIVFINEAFSYVRDERGRMNAEEGSHDDCFVRGTMVETIDGPRPIETIKIGDWVLTSKGYCPVVLTRARPKKVINNIGLRGTPDHPVILNSGIVKPLNKVTNKDLLKVWNREKSQFETLSYTKAKSIIDTQSQNAGHSKATTGVTISGSKRLNLFIGKYGLMHMVKFLMDASYTIKTTTHSIMNWITSHVLQQKSIGRIMSRIGKKTSQQSANTSIAEKRSLTATSSERQSTAGTSVGEETEMVYNLQVLWCHEYVANSILVHNCVMSTAIAYQLFPWGDNDISNLKVVSTAKMHKITNG